MATRRKRADTVTTQAPAPKRKRDSDSEPESSPDSDSELSDLGEDDLEEPIDFQQAGKANESGNEDEEDEEDDFDESSDEDDTPEEAEDSYIFEEEKDVSEDEPRKKGTGKALLKEPVSRASNRRRPTNTAQTQRRKPSTITPGSSLRESITVSSRSRNNRRSAPQPRGKAGEKSAEEKPFKLTLKVGRDKLREATSHWTPPPAAADSGSGTTAAVTPESSASATSEGIVTTRAPTMTLPARAGRGRKIVEEETSSSSPEEEEEDEDEDAEGEEDEDAEGEEIDVEEDAEGLLGDDGLNDEDAEGETDDEEMLDSDDAMNNNTGVNSPDFRSRTGTPDLSKLTRRQRGRFDELYSADLLELPTGIERPSAAKIVPLTADEAALKRAEMARRRKNLTDQRLEEEKMDTINKLLKKQTPRMRKGRGTGDATPAGGPYADSTMGGISDNPAPPPTMVRWISNVSGIRLGVPEAWMGGPAGAVFEKQTAPEVIGRRKMVEVIDDPMEIDTRA